ncbi:hypothetical protein GC194_12860 [bacterium]|nr:hypothetical protein [bacterium]
MSIQEHLAILLNLPAKEREDILLELWKSLNPTESNIDVNEYDKEVLSRREAQFDKGELKEDTWENVKSRLVEKINKL